MNTRPGNYYELLAFGLGDVTFQQFVDKFKTKYNKEQTDGFAWDPEVQLDYTYEQLEVNLGITTLPTYVDSESDQLSVFAAQHGMIWVGLDAMGEKGAAAETGINRDGFALGLGATSSTDKIRLIDGGDAETARRFGARVAAAAVRWRR